MFLYNDGLVGVSYFPANYGRSQVTGETPVYTWVEPNRIRTDGLRAEPGISEAELDLLE